MLVFVPPGFVALVHEDGALRTVLEAGVGFVGRNVQVQFVYVMPPPQFDEEGEVQVEVPATLQ